MKKINIMMIALMATVGTMFLACSDDKLGDSIFDTHDYPLDRTSYTFPLDTFIKKNFLEPYNLKFIYRMEDVGTDMQKNVVPASYEKSVDLAILTKYLWLDVYKKLGGEEFLKINSPKIIHVLGSPAYNSDGSRTVGLAEGGIKVSLMEANRLDVNQIEGDFGLNQLFFHTMHHEFGHILDQTYLHPTTFNTLSSGLYDGVGWADKNDSVQASLGFVTPYGSSSQNEDWVETLACYVTYDQTRWDKLLNTAQYDWEEIDMPLDTFELRYPGAYREQLNYEYGLIDSYTKYDRDTVGYIRQMANYDYKVDRKLIKRSGDDFAEVDSLGRPTFLEADQINGRTTILEKLDLVRSWLQYWNIDIDELRKEVQNRQYLTDEDGNFILDEKNRFINRLTQPYEGDPSKLLIDVLRQEIEEYKKLQ